MSAPARRHGAGGGAGRVALYGPYRGAEMELREIKALIALMREQGLVELEIEDKKGKVRLVRGSLDRAGRAPQAVPQAVSPRVPAGKMRSSSLRAAPAEASAPPTPELGPNQVLVRSPMVGTFYRASAPGAPPLVEEGSRVRKSQALCIIEAMKMMNELEAEVAALVVKILCDNGQPVEYGQPLMILEVE